LNSENIVVLSVLCYYRYNKNSTINHSWLRSILRRVTFLIVS